MVGQREVSCDMSLFTTKEDHALCNTVTDFGSVAEVEKYLAKVQGTTQLNGVLAAAPLSEDTVDTRCGPGETRMVIGISGYP